MGNEKRFQPLIDLILTQCTMVNGDDQLRFLAAGPLKYQRAASPISPSRRTRALRLLTSEVLPSCLCPLRHALCLQSSELSAMSYEL